MRRTVAVLVASTATLAALLTAGPSAAQDEPAASAATGAASDLPATPEEAEEALATATEVLTGDAPAPAQRDAGPDQGTDQRTDQGPDEGTVEAPVEATLALRDLRAALPLLGGQDRAQARALLARPTDGAADPRGDGYQVPATKICGGRFCVHYVTSTSDAATPAWAERTLATMNEVWDFAVNRYGYRAPVTDQNVPGNNGGDGLFDVYLADVGGRGVYGYCSPERAFAAKRASAYCVLDNDFAARQYGGNATSLLRVTAIHEFFHAVQFAYDYTEDGWMLESSATWMEERFADAINDNRQYLRYAQVARPGRPLDTYSSSSFDQYGNWAFWEYLSQRYGVGIVRKAWEQTVPTGRRDYYSVQAVGAALRPHGGFQRNYLAFTAANTTPATSYSEGRAWPKPAFAKRWKLTGKRRAASARTRLDHLSSQNLLVRPAGSLRGKRWVLRVRVNGPARATRPGATVVVVHRSGKVTRKTVALNRAGNGVARVRFGTGSVRRVMVNLTNGSTRYRCGAGTTLYSCRGVPRDDNKLYAVRVGAVRR